MSNSKLIQLIQKLNAQAQTGTVFDIDAQSVSAAYMLIEQGANTHLQEAEIIAYLCALNLLNAAIKKKEFKNQLSYGFIKRHAVTVIEKINALKNCHIAYYYNSPEHCLYFKFREIIFSFHEVPSTDDVLKASLHRSIKWGGIRLQKIAQPIFIQAYLDAGNDPTKEFLTQHQLSIKQKVPLKKTTLGDIDALKALKERLSNGCN